MYLVKLWMHQKLGEYSFVGYLSSVHSFISKRTLILIFRQRWFLCRGLCCYGGFEDEHGWLLMIGAVSTSSVVAGRLHLISFGCLVVTCTDFLLFWCIVISVLSRDGFFTCYSRSSPAPSKRRQSQIQPVINFHDVPLILLYGSLRVPNLALEIKLVRHGLLICEYFCRGWWALHRYL